MRVTNYVTRGYATFGPSEYSRRLLGIFLLAVNQLVFLSSTGQTSVFIQRINSQQRPVFLINSRSFQFNAIYIGWPIYKHPFYQRYGAILPSSFQKVLSMPQDIHLVYLGRFRVRFLFFKKKIILFLKNKKGSFLIFIINFMNSIT